jgi:DNA-binding MarR family transcriptional regulator
MTEDVVRALGYLCLGTRMKRIGERLQADTQEIIEAAGMGVFASQFPYLAAIDRLGPLTIGEIAEAVGVTQPGATRTLAQLADGGLVVLEQTDADQRRKIASLSEAGRHLVDEASRSVWPRIEQAVRDLCGTLDGPLLDQLAAIEDGLAAASLARRDKS